MSINVNNLWYGIAMYAALLVVCAVAVWLYNRSVSIKSLKISTKLNC